MTGTADIGLPPLFDTLEGALVGLVVVLPLGGADQFAKFIVEALGAKIALLLGDPFLQAKMRLDHEFAHGGPPEALDWNFLIDLSLADARQSRHVWTGIDDMDKLA